MNTPIDFLQWLRPNGPWVLTAIVPDGAVKTITAKDAKTAKAFISRHNGKANIYYSVNPTKRALSKKAQKADIRQAEYLHADLDPRDGESPAEAKKRYQPALKSLPKPTAIIDSGNGLQVLWRLDKALPPEQFAEVEACSLALTLALGGPRGTQNIDRILRVPGTVNLPNKAKRAKGRVKCNAKMLGKPNGVAYSLDDFPKASKAIVPASKPTSGPLDWAKVEEYADCLTSIDDLPPKANEKLRTIVACDGNLEKLNDILVTTGKLPKRYPSWSEVTQAMAALLKRTGLPHEKIAAWLIADLPCNQHVTKIDDAEKRRRAVRKALESSHEPSEWRCTRGGSIMVCMHNARVAIAKLGIECSYDEFHNKILIGFRGDDFRHEIGDELSDHAVIALRQRISDQFGFDPDDKATRDAIISFAIANRFDPVKDYLAQVKWDGVERLDRMVVTHFNCADTPLNRAMLRTMMIAAVRRVRKPGCKFDAITVLESIVEGWNKSSTWRVLAGDDNFSDTSILGKDSREVQEQLAGNWFHENSDLDGLDRADVEKVKAFASRQVDIARPAYGRHVVRMPRRSIEVGTTNKDVYMKSQTGNRRFWPLRVLKPIDLEKLQRDRDQLWAEAAHYEAQGVPITLDPSLWEAAAVEQEKRREKDPWEDKLANIPEYIPDGPPGADKKIKIIHRQDDKEMIRSRDILDHLLRIPSERQERKHEMRVAQIMKRNGWNKGDNKITIAGHQERGYWRWTSQVLRDVLS